MVRLGRNKKGSLIDLIFVMVAIFFFGVVLLFGFVMTSKFNDQFQSSDLIPSEGKDISNGLTGRYPGLMNNIFLFLMIFLVIGSLILASLVNTHPIFVPIYIFILIIIIVISAMLSNIYSEMASNSQVASYASQLTYVTYILNGLPLVVLFFGVLIMIVVHKIGGAYAQ